MILVCYSRHPSRVRITPWRELKFFFVNFETLCFRAVGWEETGSNPGGIENSNFFALVRPLEAQTTKFSSYLPCDTSTENFNKNIKIKKNENSKKNFCSTFGLGISTVVIDSSWFRTCIRYVLENTTLISPCKNSLVPFEELIILKTQVEKIDHLIAGL